MPEQRVWNYQLVIRRLDATEWELLRDIRLQALADAPDAFGSTLEQAERFDDEEWQRRARGWVRPGDVAFVALDKGGMVVGVRESDQCWLGAMWVAPELRRGGVGAALASAVIDWAGSWGARAVVLGVAEGNAAAAALFASLGFVPTGKRKSLREDLVEVEYFLDLEPATPA